MNSDKMDVYIFSLETKILALKNFLEIDNDHWNIYIEQVLEEVPEEKLERILEKSSRLGL